MECPLAGATDEGFGEAPPAVSFHKRGISRSHVAWTKTEGRSPSSPALSESEA